MKYLCVILFYMSFVISGHCEIILDGSLGSQGDISGPEYDIKSEYGSQSGNNLFHSFSSFNIAQNEIATFHGNHSIQHIIARITGGKTSHIDGLIRSNAGNADLFLLNPSGFIFGPTAKISIDGSFHVSTADYLTMGSSDLFYANPDQTSILSVESPTSFGFIDENIGSIVFNGQGAVEQNETSGLIVNDHNTISVISGDIYFNDSTHILLDNNTIAQPTGSLTAPGGTIQLVSVQSECTVSLLEDHIDFISVAQMGNIRINDHSLFKVSSNEKGGQIIIRSGDLTIENSILEARSNRITAGLIDIKANQISINQSNLLCEIFAIPFSQKNSSDTSIAGIRLAASNDIHISNHTDIYTSATAFGPLEQPVNTGVIDISANNIYLLNGVWIGSESDVATGGEVNLFAKGNMVIENSEVVSSTFGDNTNNGGNISLMAESILLKNGSTLESKTSSMGDGGKIDLQASGNITLSGTNDAGYASSIVTRSLNLCIDAGNAGNIKLSGNQIVISDGSQIIASTQGTGMAGEINIDAHQSINITGYNPYGTTELGFFSGIFSQSEGMMTKAGNGSTISIQSKTLNVSHHGQISTASLGIGNAGNINLYSEKIGLTSDAAISSASKSSKKGGAAGTIHMAASEKILLDDSAITTEALKTVTTDSQTDHLNGKITIQAMDTIYLYQSTITSSVLSDKGNGGDINIDPKFVLMNKSHIKANAYEGDGGNINIVADHFIQSSDSLIKASSQFGLDGEIRIESPDEQIGKDVTALPTNFIDGEKWLNSPCHIRNASHSCSLIVKSHIIFSESFEDWLKSP